MPEGFDVAPGPCVVFDEHVQIFFFCDSMYTYRQSRTKGFDGRSRVERGLPLETSGDLDSFAILSSLSAPCDDNRRRPRTFGGHWDNLSEMIQSGRAKNIESSDTESTRTDDSDDEWAMIENKPCDCDLVST